jgi:hypothetical protein
MSRKQEPRAAGMRPSAIAVSRRHDAFGNFTAIMRGDGMSRKQGSQACLEMRSPVHAVHFRLLPSDKNSLAHVLLEANYGY